MKNHNRKIALERSVINYWGWGGEQGLNAFYWNSNINCSLIMKKSTPLYKAYDECGGYPTEIHPLTMVYGEFWKIPD